MPIARRNPRRSSIDIWPGFVDALAQLLMVIIFILLVFTAGQFYLSAALSGRDQALHKLQQQVDQLADLLSLERHSNADLRLGATQLTAQLKTPKAERDRLTAQVARTHRQGQEAATQPSRRRASVAGGKADQRRRARPSRPVERADCRLAPAAFGDRGGARYFRVKGQDPAGPDRRSRQKAQHRAGQQGRGARALSLGIFRPIARDPRQPAGYPDRRRPLCVSVRGPVCAGQRRSERHRQKGARPGHRRAQTDRRGDPARHRLDFYWSTVIPTIARSTRRSFRRIGSSRPRARCRLCAMPSVRASPRIG